jgi:hypothetical protein
MEPLSQLCFMYFESLLLCAKVFKVIISSLLLSLVIFFALGSTLNKSNLALLLD